MRTALMLRDINVRLRKDYMFLIINLNVREDGEFGGWVDSGNSIY